MSYHIGLKDNLHVRLYRPQSSSYRPRLGYRVAPFLCAAICCLLTLTTEAAPRALLIGVSEYAYPQSFAPSINDLNLPGVANDLVEMQRLARQLGFQPDDIITLSNETATEQNIKRTITQQLIRGVSADDRVLIYFSGHGSVVWDENGDEEDNKDEVLLAYDAHFVEKLGRYQLTGRIIDDEMSELLAKIPSERVLFIVDACHSGNIHKRLSFNRDKTLRVKYAANPHVKDARPGEPTSVVNTSSQHYRKGFNSPLASPPASSAEPAQAPPSQAQSLLRALANSLGFDLPDPQSKGRIFFTATNESGKTMANANGSLFTGSLINALNITLNNSLNDAPPASGQFNRIDLQQLKLSVAAELQRQYPEFSSEPQLFGDELLIQKGY